ncbi:hypothetical protein [Roseburia sp. 1XD42-69]|uniref:hypothetical protein n=1 Tax=Roseburia sp. 1XD42-69 TaxID=2320088 RepID=UPI000EA29394|nr:hypothetical protein [Roseburia sp. 1XD42-69]RKJ60438.1 hypothetical protein D7Y06_23860 [Roseburia sp. 1XD42-69]
MPRTKGTTATNKASKTKLKSTKPTESNITETPKYSEVVLNYCRNGNLGFSTVHETVDISFLTRKKLTGKITTLFHLIRQTEVCKDLDSGRTATFQIDGRPVISVTQKANDYENQVFTLTKYRKDGSKQSTRKYSFNKAKNLILDVFGFETKINEDEDAEEPETSNVDMNMLPESESFEDDIDNEYADME